MCLLVDDPPQFFRRNKLSTSNEYGCIVDDQEAAAFPTLPTAVAR
jgi:hypothetical protein